MEKKNRKSIKSMTKSDHIKRRPSNEAIKKALIATYGNITLAAEQVQVARQNLSNRIHSSPELEQALSESRDRIVDFAENKLLALLNKKNIAGLSDPEPSAVYFVLKCQGKKRGWIERQEVEMSGNLTIVNIETKLKDFLNKNGEQAIDSLDNIDK